MSYHGKLTVRDVVQFVVRNNFFVILDNHSEDTTSQIDAGLWVKLYEQLMTDITVDPFLQQRLLIDLLNEPDHAGLTWQTVGPQCISNVMKQPQKMS